MLPGKSGISFMLDMTFWKNKKVFVTGHTGFKGSWCCLLLHYLGAEVTGYSLNPPTEPNLFSLAKVDSFVDSTIADIRDLRCLKSALISAEPDIVIHMAAQPLVRGSYLFPVDTFSTNVMGTVNLLEVVRGVPSVRAVVNVTTDKCYENHEHLNGYTETDRLGGYDCYSSSKACSELVTQAYRNSFFNGVVDGVRNVNVATARAGNVVGGGDWAKDRLIPDCLDAFLNNREVVFRKPEAVRPWQHVLEPLRGYLMLANKLYDAGSAFCGAWNFGPEDDSCKSVQWIVEYLCENWGQGATCRFESNGDDFHEATFLKLRSDKANNGLGWCAQWDVETALDKVIEWTRIYQSNPDSLADMCFKQIQEYGVR